MKKEINKKSEVTQTVLLYTILRNQIQLANLICDNPKERQEDYNKLLDNITQALNKINKHG